MMISARNKELIDITLPPLKVEVFQTIYTVFDEIIEEYTLWDIEEYYTCGEMWDNIDNQLSNGALRVLYDYRF